MSSEVVVTFSRTGEYHFRVHETDLAAASEREATNWLDEQWTALECEPVRPSSKVLLLDKVLGIARNAGEPRFAEQGPWARTFARSVSRLLGRPVVVVDVAENRVG